MLDSVKVQQRDSLCRETGNNKMLRSLQKMNGYRALLLEPYITSMQLSPNYTSAKLSTSAQDLPRLPVPQLKDTLAKYLVTVKPFMSADEFTKTNALVKDFEQGIGKKLQVLLEKRAKEHTNWLEEWWINTAYLEYRDPLVIYSSPGLVLPPGNFNTQNDQLRCAAKMLTASLEYKSLIDNDKIPMETMGKNPLDMGQYKKIFGTCRIPWEKRDKLSFNKESRHVTVIHNNHIFRLDILGEDNVQLNEDQLVQQFKTIMDQSLTPNTQGIGILTSEYRDNWAKAYQLLSKEEINRMNLADIEKSILVLCLDAPCGLRNLTADDTRRTLGGLQTIHGGGSKLNGANRWYDKTIQFIVGADGVRGITYEHSPAEGQPIAVLMDHLMKSIDLENSHAPESKRLIIPKRLDFVISPKVADMIENAKTNLDNLDASLDLNCFRYEKYGKNFIKSQKLSPDSFIQMAIQLAFYRLHKTPGAHYESAATRMYAGGRTETIRSCSVEAIEFAKTMLNNKSTPKDKAAALKSAINSHKKYTVEALQGFGVDRHLLGLKKAAIENDLPIHDIYSDVAYTRSSNMRISTSQVALKCDAFMCYGPLVTDGYATCYNPRDDSINFGTSAFVKGRPETSTKKYRAALEQSFQDMQDILLLNTPSKL